MRTPTKIFDDTCRVWDFDNASRFFPIPVTLSALFEGRRDLAQTQISRLSGFFRPRRKINIYFDFIDSGKLNAVASVVESWGLIGLLRGTVLLPLDLFQRMLAHPKILPHVGDPSKEAIQKQHAEGIFTNIDQLTKHRLGTGKSSEPISPVDPTRRRFASLAAEIAYNVLVLHELSHIMYGHCDYLQATSGLPSILEVAQHSKVTEDDIFLRQAMEFHADKGAMSISLGSMLSFPGDISNDFAPIYKTAEQRLFLWCFAVAGLFRLWGLRIDASKLANKEHPPTVLRFEMAMKTAHMILQDRYPEIANKFKLICHNIQDDLDSAVIDIGGDCMVRDDVISLFDDRTDDHMKAVCRFADNILIPSLQKYAYLPLRAKE